MFFDLETRELLRTRPNPIPAHKTRFLRGVRPAGPPPRPSAEPVTVQRRASNTGIIQVCGQRVALGRAHKYDTLTIHVAETTLAIEVDGQTRVVRRTTTLPVRNIKVDRPYRPSAEGSTPASGSGERITHMLLGSSSSSSHGPAPTP